MPPWFETHRFAMLLTMRSLEFAAVANSALILRRREAPFRRMAA